MKKDKETLDYDFTLVMLGTSFGLLGGMIGNILDRYFSKFGFLYEFVVVAVFVGTIVYIVRMINKMKD